MNAIQEIKDYCQRRIDESGIRTGYYAKIKEEIISETREKMSKLRKFTQKS